MTSKNEVGVTVIGHDSESETLVKGYEAFQSYKRAIQYDLTMQQIVAVINEPTSCEQFISYKCYQFTLLEYRLIWSVAVTTRISYELLGRRRRQQRKMCMWNEQYLS